jgi:transposase
LSAVAAPVSSNVVVAVDVGKNCVALSVIDANRHRLFRPVEFAMTRPALERVVARVGEVRSTCIVCLSTICHDLRHEVHRRGN